jgi:hypothetical protein
MAVVGGLLLVELLLLERFAEQGACGSAEGVPGSCRKAAWSRVRRGLGDVCLEDGLEHAPLAVPPLGGNSSRHAVRPLTIQSSPGVAAVGWARAETSCCSAVAVTNCLYSGWWMLPTAYSHFQSQAKPGRFGRSSSLANKCWPGGN